MESDGIASSQFQEALTLIELARPFEALPLLANVISRRPDFVEAYVQRARLRRRLNDLEGAIADYAKAIKLAPSAELYLARALVWLGLEKSKGAAGDAQKAIALNPDLAGGHRLLGKALGLLGDRLGAIAAYKQAARCYIDAKDKENAKLCLERVEELRSLPPLSAFQQSAIANYSKKINKEIGQEITVQTTATPAAFLKLLWQKYGQKQYQDVLKETGWLLAYDAENVEAICLRGLAYAQMGKAQQAVEDFARAARLAPEDTTVRFHRANMRLALSDGAGAVEDLSVLIETVGPEARFFAQRAAAYQSIGALDSAFKDYANALAVEPENASLYQQRAEIQQAMGEKTGAVEDYQKAATLWLNGGKWAEHQQVVEAVQQLRNQQTTTSAKKIGSSVPIKFFDRHLPVVEVLLDGIATFDMVIDRNAAHSIVTQQMAQQLNLEIVSYRYVYLADGAPIELPIARLRSVTISETVSTDVDVAIAPNKETALLGKDCFGAYSIRISGNKITFSR